MSTLDRPQAYLVDGGMASLSAAVLLIRDAGFRGINIHILEELEVADGALDGSADAVKGYVTCGGRMFTEETYVCLWDVLQSLPSLDDPAKSVKDQVWGRSTTHGVYGLLGVKREIPAIYHGLADPNVAFDALMTLMG